MGWWIRGTMRGAKRRKLLIATLNLAMAELQTAKQLFDALTFPLYDLVQGSRRATRA